MKRLFSLILDKIKTQSWGVIHDMFKISPKELSGVLCELTLAILDCLDPVFFKPVPILNLPFGLTKSTLTPHVLVEL